MAGVLSVAVTFEKIANIIITNDDQSTKSIILKKDDIVKVQYIRNQSLNTITGKVTVLDSTYSYMIIDASEKYSSNTSRIDFLNIRDIEKIEEINQPITGGN